tara:strand:+ start:442 stop:969 length:528 start_codon:yes stop_codon:yes gene_type:complete
MPHPLTRHAGVGKSFLFYPSGRNTPILRTIYGGRRGFDTLPYMGAGDVTQLTARFNLTQGNKLVCVLDEVGQKSTRIVMVRVPTLAPSHLSTPGLYTAPLAALPWQDQLKHLAGSERVQIEAKHLDACNMFDPRFFIFLSNHGLHTVCTHGCIQAAQYARPMPTLSYVYCLLTHR